MEIYEYQYMYNKLMSTLNRWIYFSKVHLFVLDFFHDKEGLVAPITIGFNIFHSSVGVDLLPVGKQVRQHDAGVNPMQVEDDLVLPGKWNSNDGTASWLGHAPGSIITGTNVSGFLLLFMDALPGHGY